METDLSLKQMKKSWHGNLRSYVIGFIGSLVITSLAFYLVIDDIVPVNILPYVLAALALTQAVVQLIFFLHLGQEEKPRWESVVFFFMLLVLVIITAGSMWIMHDLNERTMKSSMEMMHHD